MIHALVPIVALEQAKRRLQPVLMPHERQALVLAMLEDMLETLCSVREIATVTVITPDEAVSRTARAHGTEVIQESASTGLNAAVTTGVQEAVRRGWRELMIVPGDVPLAPAEEFRALVSASSSPRRAVIVPSCDEQGTNALLLAPPELLMPAFGQSSFQRHMDLARAAGARPTVLRLPGLGRDIDLPEDLAHLWTARKQSARYGFLARLDAPTPADIASPVRESA